MLVGGVPIDDRLLRELARIVPQRLRGGLIQHSCTARKCWGTIAERETILAALVDAPVDLANLRGVLLREHAWRQREGLS